MELSDYARRVYELAKQADSDYAAKYGQHGPMGFFQSSPAMQELIRGAALVAKGFDGDLDALKHKIENG